MRALNNPASCPTRIQQRPPVPKYFIILQLLPIKLHSTSMMMRRCASDIELVPCCCAGKPQPLRRSSTTVFFMKMAQFLYRFVPITFQASTSVIPWARSSLKYTMNCRLVPFQCSSHHPVLFTISIAMWPQRKFWRRPPRNIEILIKSSGFAANLRNYSPTSWLGPYLDGNNALMK